MADLGLCCLGAVLLGGATAAALADRRVGKRLDLRGVGNPWSWLDETGGMVGLDGCKRGLARAASWDPFGVLATDLRLDRAFFVLGDLFADIDFDGQIVSAPLPDADALGVRGGMDCVRGIAGLRRYGVCRMHAGAFADALAGSSSDRFALRWIRCRVHDGLVDGLARRFRTKCSQAC